MALKLHPRPAAHDRVIDVGRCAGGSRFVLPAPGFGLLHLLVSGKTESGKSSTVARITGVLCARPEIAFVGVDHKGGLELLPFERRFTEVATTVAHTEDLFGRLVDLIDVRGETIRAAGRAEGRTIRAWESWMGPRLAVVVDEGGEVARSKTAVELLDSLAARGRALGVHVVVSTQYALTSEFPTTLLLNLTGRVCHRMGTTTQYATALAVDQAELRAHGFEPIPEGNRHRGVCYVNGIPRMVDLSRCRADLVTDTALDQQVARTAHLRWAPEQIFNPLSTSWWVVWRLGGPRPTATLKGAGGPRPHPNRHPHPNPHRRTDLSCLEG